MIVKRNNYKRFFDFYKTNRRFANDIKPVLDFLLSRKKETIQKNYFSDGWSSFFPFEILEDSFYGPYENDWTTGAEYLSDYFPALHWYDSEHHSILFFYIPTSKWIEYDYDNISFFKSPGPISDKRYGKVFNLPEEWIKYHLEESQESDSFRYPEEGCSAILDEIN